MADLDENRFILLLEISSSVWYTKLINIQSSFLTYYLDIILDAIKVKVKQNSPMESWAKFKIESEKVNKKATPKSTLN